MQLSSIHQALGLIPDATKQILSNNQTEGIRTTLRWGLDQRTADRLTWRYSGLNPESHTH